MEDTLSKFMSESAKRHEENSNLIKEIRASTDAAIRNQGASIKTLEIQIGQMSKVLQERGFGSLPSSTETNLRGHVKSISTIVETYSYLIRRMGTSQYAVFTGQNHTLIKEKDPGSFTLPCFINNVCFNNALADLGASVSVMPLSTYLNLGLGELAHTKLTVELADRTVKYPKGIAENMLVEARLIRETLVLNRSLDLFFRDYIELNDLNVPLELRRDQVDDLMPTIKEGEVVEEFRARNDARMVSKIFGYPSDCDHDKKIRIDCAYNLKFSCMIDFAVLEDMDAYRDEGMGDVIFGEPFLREVGINAKRFEGMITIHNGNEEVTYQMVRSHPRFKHHTNEQCNKIPPLLKSIFSLCILFRNPFSSTTIGDENPIRTLGDYSKPSHEGYRNTIELPEGNNVVPLRSDTIRLVQNGCSFHGLRSEDPSQHLKDFLKLVDSLDLDGENRERMRLLPRHGIDLWLQVQIFYDHVNPITRRTIDQSIGGKLRNLNPEESCAILEDLALYDNESWNDPRDFAKSVKAITLPQDVPSTSDRRLIELENQVQRFMEAHLALTQSTQVNKITTSCEICSGPHNTQYCMENPEQAFVEYASSRIDEVGDVRLSRFEADFKRQQGEMTNKIDTLLKVIIDQIAGTLPSDTVKNPKLGTHPVSSARSYPTKDP
ncbi:MAK10-like protein [Tanacetum coccineum]